MPNDLVASTPPKGDTAAQRLYAQAAGSVACHECVKAPPETINLDYLQHRPRQRPPRPAALASAPDGGQPKQKRRSRGCWGEEAETSRSADDGASRPSQARRRPRSGRLLLGERTSRAPGRRLVSHGRPGWCPMSLMLAIAGRLSTQSGGSRDRYSVSGRSSSRSRKVEMSVSEVAPSVISSEVGGGL